MIKEIVQSLATQFEKQQTDSVKLDRDLDADTLADVYYNSHTKVCFMAYVATLAYQPRERSRVDASDLIGDLHKVITHTVIDHFGEEYATNPNIKRNTE